MAMPVNATKIQRAIPTVRLAQTGSGLNLTLSKVGMAGVSRFQQFVATVVHRRLGDDIAPAALLALTAIALDGIGFEDHLLPYLQALQHRTAWGVWEYATWTVEEQTHRRAPSPFTLLAARGVDWEKVNWIDLMGEVERGFARWYAFPTSVPIGSRLKTVLADGLAYFQHVLPGPLFGLVSGILPWSPLPSQVWARRFGVAPSSEQTAPVDPVMTSAGEAVISTLYEGRAPLTGGWYIQLLHDICNELAVSGVRRSNAKIRQELVRRIHNLTTHLSEVGPVEALLTGWALDIIEFGSARKADPALKTLSNYLKAAVKPLHKALSQGNRHPLELETHEWDKLLTDLIHTQSNPMLRPALGSFQRYLVRAHDMEPLPWLFTGQTAVRSPRANVIWPHAFDAWAKLVAQGCDDVRAIEQVKVWIAILRCTGLRFGELIQLELSSIQWSGTGPMRIVVAPPRRKSDATRGVREIDSQQAIEVIHAWKLRRQTEALSANELLFGDPYAPERVYRLSACYSALSTALKSVTGDSDIVVHATRHSFASTTMAKALIADSSSPGEISRVEAVRVSMGHADVRTTFLTYCHLYEDVLRACLDAAIQRVPLRVQDLAMWTHKSACSVKQYAATLRQHRHRHKEWNPWKVLCDAACSVVAEPIAVTPEVVVLPTSPKSWGLDLVHRLAEDWINELTIEQLVLRSDLTQTQVCSFLKAFESACSRLHTAMRARGKVMDWRAWFADQSNLTRLKNPQWDLAWKCLAETIAADPARDVGCWLDACGGAGIHAEPDRLADITRFLRDSGVGLTSLVVRGVTENLASAYADIVAGVYLARPQMEVVAAHGGKPRVYVQLLTKPPTPGASAPPATSNMKALRGLLLVATAYADLRTNKVGQV